MQRSDKTIYCAEDERVAGSSTTNYTVSPFHLRAQTLGDLLKQRSPQSLNVAVAGKDRAAVMMGGAAVDQRWYWNGKGSRRTQVGRSAGDDREGEYGRGGVACRRRGSR